MKNELCGRGSLPHLRAAATDLRSTTDEGVASRADIPCVMAGKTIDGGVRGAEADPMRLGARGFRFGLAGGAFAAALLALFGTLLLAASPADAKPLSVDPCTSGEPPPPGQRRICTPVEGIYFFDLGRLFDFERNNTWCGASEKLAGTDPIGLGGSPRLGNEHWAGWDYWSLRGEWVSWSGDGRWLYRPWSEVLWAYSPRLHNSWLGGPWPARAINYCEAAPATRSQRSLSGRAQADETVEQGDAGDDVIKGEGEGDVLVAEGGDDAVHGARGDDHLVGGFGDDAVNGGGGEDTALGGGGEDTARGGGGDDQLLGGPHDDTAFGGGGSDELFDNEGNEELHGGPGDDRFSAHDRSADTIRCGGGEDIVVSDRRDRVSADCEHVYRTRDEAPRRPPKT